MKVVVLPESYEKTASGAVSGKIYLQCEDHCFPDCAWFDFPVVILGWWLEALHRLSTRASKQEELVFMEGPFRMTLSEPRGGVSRYEWQAPGLVASGEVDFEDLLKEAISAGSLSVETALDSFGLDGDLDRLSSLLATVSRNGPVHLPS